MQKITIKGHSVQKLEWKQTDGRTGGGDCITSRANAVDNKNKTRNAWQLTWRSRDALWRIGETKLSTDRPTKLSTQNPVLVTECLAVAPPSERR